MMVLKLGAKTKLRLEAAAEAWPHYYFGAAPLQPCIELPI